MTRDELAQLRLARALRSMPVGCAICGHSMAMAMLSTFHGPNHLVIPDELCPECRRVVDGRPRVAS